MITEKNTYNYKSFPFGVAIGFFLIAALLGSLMRLIFVREIPFFEYKYVLHAHSHIAMLGWGFTALGTVMVYSFISNHQSISFYKNLLIGNTFAAFGMLVSFLLEGYGIVSITFCTIHLVIAYLFTWKFIKDTRTQEKSYAKKFAVWSLILMIISTIGLLGIGPVSVFLGKLHPLYYACIQFFLHFQFNGWFTFGIIALLCMFLPNNGNSKHFPKGTFAFLLLSLILTYALSITWSTPASALFYLNSIGVILQIVAFIMLMIGFTRNVTIPKTNSKIIAWLLGAGIFSLLFKIFIQGAVAIPLIAKISYTIRNFVIGFIHLTMLGAFSMTILAILLYKNYIPLTTLAKNGYRLLLFGFVATEGILFVQGILLWSGYGFIPNYYEIILIATMLLPISLLLISLTFFNKKEVHSKIQNI